MGDHETFLYLAELVFSSRSLVLKTWQPTVISLFFSTPFPLTLAKLLPRDNKLLQQENIERWGQTVSIILSKGVVFSTVYQLDAWLAEA